MAGRVEVAVIEGAPGFAMRERADRPARAGDRGDAPARRGAGARADRRGADRAERHHPLQRDRHRRLRAGAARRRAAGGERDGAGDHRLQRARVGDRLGLRQPRGASATPSGGWRWSSPTGSCSGWRCRRRTDLGAVKLAGRDAARFLAAARPRGGGGRCCTARDAMRVALKRAALVEALVGPEGAAEMRLERIAARRAAARPGGVLDALKATGLLPRTRGRCWSRRPATRRRRC